MGARQSLPSPAFFGNAQPFAYHAATTPAYTLVE